MTSPHPDYYKNKVALPLNFLFQIIHLQFTIWRFSTPNRDTISLHNSRQHTSPVTAYNGTEQWRHSGSGRGDTLKWEEQKKSTRLECVQVNRCWQDRSKTNRYQEGLITKTSKYVCKWLKVDSSAEMLELLWAQVSMRMIEPWDSWWKTKWYTEESDLQAWQWQAIEKAL